MSKDMGERFVGRTVKPLLLHWKKYIIPSMVCALLKQMQSFYLVRDLATPNVICNLEGECGLNHR